MRWHGRRIFRLDRLAAGQARRPLRRSDGFERLWWPRQRLPGVPEHRPDRRPARQVLTRAGLAYLSCCGAFLPPRAGIGFVSPASRRRSIERGRRRAMTRFAAPELTYWVRIGADRGEFEQCLARSLTASSASDRRACAIAAGAGS